MVIIGKKKYDEFQKHISNLTEDREDLQRRLDNVVRIQNLQVTQDNLTVNSTGEYQCNDYTTYSQAVTAIENKVNCTATKGCLMSGRIVSLRSVFIMGDGIEITAITDNAEKELAFSKEFLKFNGLDKSMPLDFAKESEKTGKFCVRLYWDADHTWKWQDKSGKEHSEKGMAICRYFPWQEYNYKIITQTEPYKDYLKYVEMQYTDSGSPKTANGDEFVYRKFGGRIDKPDQSTMVLWECLNIIDRLDCTLRDLRGINNLFASPIPNIECETNDQAAKVNKLIADFNWKINKFFAHTGVLKYAQPSVAGIMSLINEITAYFKTISGVTSIPIHFLGMPDLMSNRSTADNLLEIVIAGTQTEREKYESGYSEIIKKSIDIRNNQMSGLSKLDASKLDLQIKTITQSQWDRIEKIYVPMAADGKLSIRGLLEKIPGVDVEVEVERLQSADKEWLDRTVDSLNKSQTTNKEG